MNPQSLEFSRLLRQMIVGEQLICWYGCLFDNRHPWIRGDRLRLWTVEHPTSDEWTLRSTAGVRPASVEFRRPLVQSDYTLYFAVQEPAVVITAPPGRKGRHAWIEHLLEDETTETLNRCVTVKAKPPALPDSEDGLFCEMARMFDTFYLYDHVYSLKVIPLPNLVLVTGHDARVFWRTGIEDSEDPVELDDGRMTYAAEDVYGQGVLAAEPISPVGVWYSLPPGHSLVRERDDIHVDLTPRPKLKDEND